MDNNSNTSRSKSMSGDLSSSMPSLAEYSDLEGESEFGERSIVTYGDRSFKDKVVIITGAGGQFGRAGCLYFGKRGARVAGLDRDKEALKETFAAMDAELGGGHFDFKPYVCDVTDAKQIDGIISSIALRHKRIDMLWNNAGYQGKITPLLDYDTEDFKLVMDVNVTGMFNVMQAVARKMKEQGADQGCSIVNTASVAAMRGTPAMIAYASSKAAVIAMTVGAAKELAQYGIRVNAISPALIGPGFMWDRQNELHAKVGAPFFAEDPETVGANKIKGVPLKRLGSVEEVLNVVAFLLSTQSSYMTGNNIVVDGGMAAGLKA